MSLLKNKKTKVFKLPEVTEKSVPEVPIALPKKEEAPAMKDKISL